MTAFYAFCRDVDDAVDLARDERSARQAVDRWDRELDLVEDGRPTTVLGAELCLVLGAFPVSTRPLRLVVAGVRRDLDTRRYETFEELYDYCYHVASAVGQFVCAVTGPGGDDVRRYAELTGIAVQLTNILRDVGEDALSGRIYLPLEDLARFGLDERDVLERRRWTRLVPLLRFEASRNRALYVLADGAFDPARYPELYFARALSRTYSELLELLVTRNFGVDGRPVSLGTLRKLVVLLRCRADALLPSRAWIAERWP